MKNIETEKYCRDCCFNSPIQDFEENDECPNCGSVEFENM